MTKKSANVYITLGASNHAEGEREANDLYCTHPDAVRELMKLEKFSPVVLEPCAGLGHIAEALREGDYEVIESDLLTRGRAIAQKVVFDMTEPITTDIVTNPPYKCATKMLRHLLNLMENGCKMAVWLRILYLESAERKRLFEEFPPVRVWISSRRIPCGKDGKFGASAQGYAWYVWKKGYEGETTLKWF